MIQGHGDDAHNYSQEIKSNFSSNIFARQDISALEDYLCRHISIIHSYPEPDACSLQRRIAEHHSLSSNHIMATNGATEAIYLVARNFFGARSAVLAPTFSEYADGCLANEHQLRYICELEAMPDDTELLWLCNPNNPTGRVIEPERLRHFMRRHPKTMIVVDRSYAYFTKKDTELVPGSAPYPHNLIEVHSLTKKYAVPGLRLGYLVAHPTVIREIRAYKMPWSVNALAAEAGLFLLDRREPPFDFDHHLALAHRLMGELAAIDGLEVLPSDTHFFLCRLPMGLRATDLKVWLVHNFGILIRDASNFEGLDERYIRIASQTEDENDQLVKAITVWMHQ